MITYELISPESPTEAGEVNLELRAANGFEPTEEMLESIRVSINDISLSVEAEIVEDVIVITGTFTAIGGQDMRISVLGTDEDGQSTGHFSLLISSESLYRTPDYVYAPYMEQLASYLPDYTRAGVDRYSVFQQLLNPIALKMDNIRQKTQSHHRSLLINASDLSDPDWLYEYELDSSEEFNFVINSEGASSVVPPTVWGYSGVNRINLRACESFRDFWEEAIPTRFTVIESINPALVALTPSISIRELEVLAPFDVPTNGRVYLTLHSSSSIVDLTSEELGQAFIVLEGISGTGADQKEVILLLEEGDIPSKLNWSKIESVSLETNIESASGEVLFGLLPTRLGIRVEPSFKSVLNRRTDTVKWQTGEDEIGSYVDKLLSGEGHIIDIARGESSFSAVQRYRLADVNGDAVSITDHSMNLSGNFFYGTDLDTLYIWDRRDRLPSNLALMTGITEQPEQSFAIVAYELQTVEDDAPSVVLSVEMERALGLKTARSWMWSVVKPDGETLYIKPSTGEFFEYEYWNDNPVPINYYGIKERNFDLTLDEIGDYMFELRILYTDGTTDIIRRIFQLHQKNAIAQYDLDHLIDLTDEINRVHVTENGELWISNAETIYKMRPVYDTFMIDTENSKLYFREEYDAVEVEFNE